MNNFNLTRAEFDKLVKEKDLEVFSTAQFTNFLKSNEELLIRGEKGELDEIEKSDYNDVFDEIRSFITVDVFDKEENSSKITKSICFMRQKQVEWDPIEKGEDGEIMKARYGTYTDTPYNRKKGRVGARYGTKKAPEDKGGSKIGGTGKPTQAKESSSKKVVTNEKMKMEEEAFEYLKEENLLQFIKDESPFSFKRYPNLSDVGDVYLSAFLDKYDSPKMSDKQIESAWEIEYGESIDAKIIRENSKEHTTPK